MRSRTVLFFGLLFLLFVAGTSAMAAPIVIGNIQLINFLAPDPNGLAGSDQLFIMNLTGVSADVADSLAFSKATVTINGTPTGLSDIAAGTTDSSISEPTTWITSLDFSASLGTSPLLVTLMNGDTQWIAPSASFSYSGPVLDTDSGNSIPSFDILATPYTPSPVPEPMTLSLLGSGLAAVWFRHRGKRS